jgi:hypothetical protein
MVKPAGYADGFALGVALATIFLFLLLISSWFHSTQIHLNSPKYTQIHPNSSKCIQI